MKYYTTNSALGVISDKSTRALFNQIVDNILPPCDAVHAYVNTFDEIYQYKFTNRLVIIAIDDLMEYVPQYNWWTNSPQPDLFKQLYQLAQNNSTQEFVFLLRGRRWSIKHFAPLTNVRVVDFTIPPGDRYYYAIEPVEKFFASQKIGIALNRQMRVHRISLVGLLYGLHLNQNCYITAIHLYKQLNKINSTEYLDHSDWQFESTNETVKHLMQQGFCKIVNDYHAGTHFQQRDTDIYPQFPGTETVLYFDNTTNFEKELRTLYANSFVEFISCRLYSEPCISIDEKFINSVYARNFPIIIGSAGTVELCRQSGLDMFDDIIDHGYDLIANPIDRLYQAVTSNQHLLTTPEITKQHWQKCQDRFNKNIAYSRENLYNYFKDQILLDCNRQISDLLKEKFQ